MADLDDYTPVTKGDRLEGFQCPNCGEDYDELMGNPALKSVGHNTGGSGLLFDCSCCGKRVTEWEIRTGTRTPWNDPDAEDFEPDRDLYINPDSEYDKQRGAVSSNASFGEGSEVDNGDR